MLQTTVFFFVTLGVCWWTQLLVRHRGHTRMKNHPPLVDLVHDLTPNLSEWEPVLDYFIAVPIVLLIVMGGGKRMAILDDFMGYFSVLLLLRCLTTVVTIFPRSNAKCLQQKGDIDSPLKAFSGTCYDKLFSGHTAFIMLLALIFAKHKLLPVPNVVLWAVTAAWGTAIIMTRAHYTVDVIISALLTYFVFDAGLRV